MALDSGGVSIVTASQVAVVRPTVMIIDQANSSGLSLLYPKMWLSERETIEAASMAEISLQALMRHQYQRNSNTPPVPAPIEISNYGSQCIVVAIDAKRDATDGWQVYTHGGRTATGIDVVTWAKQVAALGAGEILLTSMDRDGTKGGFDLALTRAVSDAVAIPVIASGGVGSLDHLADGVLEGHADAVLAASIFHFGTFTVGEAKRHMADRGIPMRLT